MTQSEFLFVGNRAGPWQRYSKRLVDSASLQNLPVREEIRSLCQNMSTTSLNALKVQLTFFFPGEKHCIALSFDANSWSHQGREVLALGGVIPGLSVAEAVICCAALLSGTRRLLLCVDAVVAAHDSWLRESPGVILDQDFPLLLSDSIICSQALFPAPSLKPFMKQLLSGFPGGAVVKSPPANAGDMGSSPGLGRSHMPRSN